MTPTRALLEAVAGGDPAAMAALYDRHAGWLHARLSRRCSDPETVREVLQDTFVHGVACGGRAPRRAGRRLAVDHRRARRLVDAFRAQERPPRGCARRRWRRRGTAARRPGPASPSAEDRVLAGLEYVRGRGHRPRRISPELREVLRATVVDGLSTRRPRGCWASRRGPIKSRATRARAELRAVLARMSPSPMGGPA
ncbi:RNA polymerase sigma factor [Streptomyces heliomycini]